MAEDKAQKTEPATPRKREEARRQGQVAQSRELQSVAVLAAALGALASPLGSDLVEALMRAATGSFRAASAPPSTLADFHAALLVPFSFVALAAKARASATAASGIVGPPGSRNPPGRASSLRRSTGTAAAVPR